MTFHRNGCMVFQARPCTTKYPVVPFLFLLYLSKQPPLFSQFLFRIKKALPNFISKGKDSVDLKRFSFLFLSSFLPFSSLSPPSPSLHPSFLWLTFSLISFQSKGHSPRNKGEEGGSIRKKDKKRVGVGTGAGGVGGGGESVKYKKYFFFLFYLIIIFLFYVSFSFFSFSPLLFFPASLWNISSIKPPNKSSHN